MPHATKFTSSLSVTAMIASASSHPASFKISKSVALPQIERQSSFETTCEQRSGLESTITTDFFS